MQPLVLFNALLTKLQVLNLNWFMLNIKTVCFYFFLCEIKYSIFIQNLGFNLLELFLCIYLPHTITLDPYSYLNKNDIIQQYSTSGCVSWDSATSRVLKVTNKNRFKEKRGNVLRYRHNYDIT